LKNLNNNILIKHKKEPKMEKRCDNCKYFKSLNFKGTAMGSWCDHEEHKGMIVANFTSCPEYEPKEVKTTPFDGMKFYLKDTNTGELAINYICEDCGKEMPNAPYHWWLVVPVTTNAVKHPTKRHGYHFRCEECEKKLGDKK
jgi:ribosomal protein L44E